MEANLTESNQNVVQTFLRRCKDGLRVDLLVNPEIEDFFKQWSGEATVDASVGGRSWRPIPGQPALRVWAYNQPKSDHENYMLSMPGRPIIWDGFTNISFLRLVGASQGISFIIEDLISRTELDKMADKVKKGEAWFYSEFLKPIEMEVVVSRKRERPAGDPHASLF